MNEHISEKEFFITVNDGSTITNYSGRKSKATKRYIKARTDGVLLQSDDYSLPLDEWESCVLEKEND